MVLETEESGSPRSSSTESSTVFTAQKFRVGSHTGSPPAPPFSAIEKPLHRRVIAQIEESTKRITVSRLGRLLRPERPRSPIEARRLRSILFLRNDGIGDMVLSTPMWRILKARYPTIVTGIVASSRNSPVVENDPDIDHRYDCSRERVPNLLRTARETRKIDWDLVMPLIYYKKTKMALLCKLFAPKALSSMVLMHANSSERYSHLYSIVLPTDYEPSTDLMLDLMRVHFERTLNLQVSDDEWRPSLHPLEDDLASIQSTVARLLSVDGTRGYVQVHLEAKDAFHEFGLANSLALSRHLTARHPAYSVIWTASPAASGSAASLLASTPTPKVHFQPTTTVHELVGIVRNAALVVSPDTSIIHIAAAERRPLVGLYEGFPHQWRPSHERSIVVTPTHPEPVSAIRVDTVLKACCALLTR